ncbi:MAG: hypothetical protein DGJ47_000176 [Rickettsiaceae bacterium]
MSFQLHERLEKDAIYVSDKSLCQIRLVNNSDFPWLILVPKLENITEITDLSLEQYQKMNSEILDVSKIMQKLFSPDKLNIATIGNIVSQMHIHIIARYKNDKLFPDPVWGHPATPYSEQELKRMQENLLSLL